MQAHHKMDFFRLPEKMETIPPAEKLADFIRKYPDTLPNQEKLRDDLKQYKANDRKKIIDAKLPMSFDQTSIHIAASRGKLLLLHILLVENKGN